MHAIVTVLDSKSYSRIIALWQELETECGLTGIRSTPIPHFSWHIAQDYDFSKLLPGIQEIVASTVPFIGRTSGLGLFTRENPVLYFPLVRTSNLTDLHSRVWERAIRYSQAPSPYYEPEAWMPHITLAYGDLNQATLGCAIEKFAFQMSNWEITVDNLAVVYQSDSQVGELKSKFPFTG